MRTKTSQLAFAEAKSLLAQARRTGGSVEGIRRLIDDGGHLDRTIPEERWAWDFRAAVLRELNKLVNGKGKR